MGCQRISGLDREVEECNEKIEWEDKSVCVCVCVCVCLCVF